MPQVRFALSSDAAFGQSGASRYEIYMFYDHVVTFLTDPRLKEFSAGLIEEWNTYVMCFFEQRLSLTCFDFQESLPRPSK